MFGFASIPSSRRLFTRPISLRKGKCRRSAPRARLHLETLEDRRVLSVAGFSFIEQQGFPGPQTPPTLINLPTAFADQLVQTYTNLQNGTQTINGQTLDQIVQDQVRQMAQNKGYTAYNISDSFGTPDSSGSGAIYDNNYTASLDTSQANPTVHMHYYVTGNTLDFTINNVSGPHGSFFGFMDASFHVDYSMTINVDLTLPSALSPQATVSSSATTVIDSDTVTTKNILVAVGELYGDDIVGQIAGAIAGDTKTLPNVVPTGTLNSLLQGEAAKGYTHLHAGLDGNGNLVLTAQQPNLVVNGSNKDDIVLRTTADGGVQVYAGGQWGTFDPGYLQKITINSGGGDSQISINGVPSGVSVQVNGASNSADTVYIGNDLLTNIAGPVSVNYSNGSGKASIVVEDTNDAASRTATITGSSVQFSKLPTISYSGNVTNLSVWGGSGQDTYIVRGTSAPLWLVPGAGTNDVSLSNYKTLTGFAGTVNVDGSQNGGQDTLTIDDSLDSARNLTLTSGTVSFSGVPTIYYEGLAALNLVMPNGANTITVNSATQSTTIYNTAGDIVSGPAPWEVVFVSTLPSWDEWWLQG
jgi:hypothetical protein